MAKVRKRKPQRNLFTEASRQSMMRKNRTFEDYRNGQKTWRMIADTGKVVNERGKVVQGTRAEYNTLKAISRANAQRARTSNQNMNNKVRYRMKRFYNGLPTG